ncbi:uncharacterized protein BJ212DRAFT_1333952 [Suillus subaureus]|uniref:Uncharacterized protein n=1 Tax=Suillus subaureus TaxID=48587 RepID=A0A9P7JH12_9AGAM|nr:uncharacterized protein BJ212DRAFT_1400982 [Suillus subaureus]XP_041196569.1 uncharacterized protein BJ212DRAFT_1333952 [Suillus subaureus]KAG1800069.1 hypothetical protein BJ212DRAFT_1400982 [Suillus subaureus]KAG1821829.1 hypothetical protein BJ212DRAFT_1333952 [Suillus subaureus]
MPRLSKHALNMSRTSVHNDTRFTSGSSDIVGISLITDLTTSGFLEVCKIHVMADLRGSSSRCWKPARARK